MIVGTLLAQIPRWPPMEGRPCKAVVEALRQATWEVDSEVKSLETNAGASSQESWRVFCAIDLATSARTILMRQISGLREMVPHAQASWSREENTHLTLKFLGDIQTSRLSNLSHAATRAVADFSPFQITLQETGVFPKHGPPRVLWIGVKDESGRLAELHTRLEEACAKEGFGMEQRPFHPHLTIARLRKPHGARTLALAHKEMPFEPAHVTVEELLVIRSEPSAAGSRYSVISRHRVQP